MGVLTQTPVMGKRRSAADVRGATNQHKSESPASQKAGSTNLDTLQPAELNVVAGIRRGRHPVDAGAGLDAPSGRARRNWASRATAATASARAAVAAGQAAGPGAPASIAPT